MTALISYLLYLVLGSMLRGWVFSVLWGWFIVPLGGPHIGIAHAIGISMVVSFLTYQHQDASDGKSASDTAITVIVIGVVQAFMALAMGYVVHSFMVTG